ncbi:hypothetical protein [Calidithermus terrae]|uniref:hypothetical protein n=1 Tax=Calidithermus terrae TaxID=1408545 RepID=UPI0011C36E8D|nr:hypothetical protein [Calidithermus terrae]
MRSPPRPSPPPPRGPAGPCRRGSRALAGELGPRAARLAGEWPRLQREHALIALGRPRGERVIRPYLEAVAA